MTSPREGKDGPDFWHALALSIIVQLLLAAAAAFAWRLASSAG
jgi:hypothetical protein